MSEKMREDFFEWYYQQEQFGDAHQEELWKAWQASRSALVVKLPPKLEEMFIDSYQEGWDDAIGSCRVRVESVGVTCK